MALGHRIQQPAKQRELDVSGAYIVFIRWRVKDIVAEFGLHTFQRWNARNAAATSGKAAAINAHSLIAGRIVDLVVLRDICIDIIVADRVFVVV